MIINNDGPGHIHVKSYYSAVAKAGSGGFANIGLTEFHYNNGNVRSVRIGDAIDCEVEDIVPFGVDSGEPIRFQGMFHPVGSDLTMAEAQRSRINAFGIQYEGKSGLSKSEFSWAA